MTIVLPIQQFITYLEKKGRTDSTIVAYKKDLEQLANFLENKKISQITSRDLKEFIRYLIEKQKFSKKTASRKVNSLKTFFAYLEGEGIIKTNPAEDVKHPKFTNKPPRILSILEYKSIRDSARDNIRFATILELLLQTGAKIGEISRLKIADIKLKTNPNKMIIQEFASNPIRIVELNDVVVKVIKKYLKYRRIQNNNTEYLFITRTGRRLLIRNIRTALDRIIKKAGVKSAKINDIRNTFIVYQLENGMSLKKLAEIVGHRRISSTQRYLELTAKKIRGQGTRIIPL